MVLDLDLVLALGVELGVGVGLGSEALDSATSGLNINNIPLYRIPAKYHC